MTIPKLQPSKLDKKDNNWKGQNIPLLISTGEEIEMEIEEEEEIEKCGIACYRPSWGHAYATRKVFIIAFGCLGIIQGMSWSYFTGTLSTLEKRFKISSETSGMMLVGTEVAEIMFSIVVSHFGARAHRTRWIAVGVLLNAISCYVLASPHLLYGSGNDALSLTQEYGKEFIHELEPLTSSATNVTQVLSRVSLCKRETHAHKLNEEHVKDEGTSITPLLIIFFSRYLHGLGGLVFYALGGPYLDDNTKRKNLPLLFGITLSLRLIGPTFGFLLAAATLKLYVNPTLTPIVSPADSRWIGAWWMGWLLVGSLMVVFAFIIGLFPRRLKKHKGDLQSEPEPQAPQVPSIAEIPQAVKGLLKNKINVCNNLGGIFFVFSAMGYWTYLPKYMETIFMQSASDASIVSGMMGIISQASGLMLSGILISRYQFSAQSLARWNSFTGLIHMIVMLSFVTLGCDGGNFVFGDQYSNGTYNVTTTCNQNCNCDTHKILPVCYAKENIVFYSGCHAGCDIYEEDNNILRNCTCLSDPNATLSLGKCAVGCQHVFLIFLIVNALIKFVDSTGRIGSTLISYRCVKLEERSLSIGLHMTLLSLFAFLPSPIVFGRIIDSVCLVWGGDTHGGNGNCMLYDGKELRYVFNIFAASLVFIGVIFDTILCIYVKDLDLYKEPEVDKVA